VIQLIESIEISLPTKKKNQLKYELTDSISAKFLKHQQTWVFFFYQKKWDFLFIKMLFWSINYFWGIS